MRDGEVDGAALESGDEVGAGVGAGVVCSARPLREEGSVHSWSHTTSGAIASVRRLLRGGSLADCKGIAMVDCAALHESLGG